MNTSKNSLETYNKKRDFEKSPEPKGEEGKGKDNVFVIQKHDATNLHYDFRLEVNGVLKSWAVPKGPSTDTKVKRLAIRTEDHPFSYKDFEGIIPEGHYGAGEVIIWDCGEYENISQKDGEAISMEEALEKGHISVNIKGEKLQGGYHFVRTSKGKNEQWLLIKAKDDQADGRRNPTSTEPQSVLSGKTIEDLKKEEKRKKVEE